MDTATAATWPTGATAAARPTGRFRAARGNATTQHAPQPAPLAAMVGEIFWEPVFTAGEKLLVPGGDNCIGIWNSFPENGDPYPDLVVGRVAVPDAMPGPGGEAQTSLGTMPCTGGCWPWRGEGACTSGRTAPLGPRLPDIILKGRIGNADLFWPACAAYDGTYLRLGEFKFSERLLRFSPR